VFFKKREESASVRSVLDEAVARAMPGADPDTHRIVAAIVGLCGVVAYADRQFSAVEQEALLRLLRTIRGMSETHLEGVVSSLNDAIVTVSGTEMARHARTLVELGDRDLRRSVLELLLDLASSDQVLSQEEVVVLRQVTKALGLEQSDYNRLQERHRSLLEALR
jgi:uncharacterized tellurite resistance protein B-like protein